MSNELHLFVFRYDGGSEGDYVLAADEADARALLQETVEGSPFGEDRFEGYYKVEVEQLPDDQTIGWTYVDEPGHPKEMRTPAELAARYGRSYQGGWA